ncbi:hypothetical protein [Legionella impletisoli]|nr:hypothetical protein [Legionella impletisoli]
MTAASIGFDVPSMDAVLKAQQVGGVVYDLLAMALFWQPIAISYVLQF